MPNFSHHEMKQEIDINSNPKNDQTDFEKDVEVLNQKISNNCSYSDSKDIAEQEIENVQFDENIGSGTIEGFEDLKSLLNPILYMRGVPATSFYLILQGNVVVCSGQEGFYVKLGPFNYIGLESLTKSSKDTPYVPDFSAKVINKARVLMINKDQYDKIINLEIQRKYF